MQHWNRMPDALKEQVFNRLEELAAVANLSMEDRIAYDKALDRYRVSRIVEEDARRASHCPQPESAGTDIRTDSSRYRTFCQGNRLAIENRQNQRIMGRYLIIGLKLEACVYKDRINKYVSERRTKTDILAELENTLRLGSEYDRKEEEDCYTYSLKQEICDKELLSFLKCFYDLRYIGENRESDTVMEKLSALSPQERLNLLEQKRFECFQEDEKTHYCYLDNCGWFEIPVYTRKIVLSMDGKIIMECYNEILDFFRRCIAKQLEDFRLTKALDVYLSD